MFSQEKVAKISKIYGDKDENWTDLDFLFLNTVLELET
jgi:hypothetical protein